MYECNECTVDTVNAMGIPESTLRTTRIQADRIKESCKSTMRMMASKSTHVRALIMEKSERTHGLSINTNMPILLPTMIT
jgi:hypothetical protein